jgi:hypothetical protein
MKICGPPKIISSSFREKRKEKVRSFNLNTQNIGTFKKAKVILQVRKEL